MTASGGIGGFRVEPGELGFLGQGLKRPECVLCTANGDTYVSNFEGGVTRLPASGGQHDIVDGSHPIGTNGFAITAEGDFLCANLHPDGGGGAWRVRRDGSSEPFLVEIDGRPLPPANFVGVDKAGRVWITVSTWREPRQLAYRPDVADGFIILVDRRGSRIVLDDCGYTNEAIVDPSGEWLYVNETMGRRTRRHRIAEDGSLGPRETVTEYGDGVYPDGLALDEAGGVWMTSVISNRVIHVAPDGAQTVVIEENDPETLAETEIAYRDGTLSAEHMAKVDAEIVRSVSSIAFGGADRRTVYLGNLLDDRIYTFRAPIAGAAPSHWSFAW